jgi:hypothetical protein
MVLIKSRPFGGFFLVFFDLTARYQQPHHDNIVGCCSVITSGCGIMGLAKNSRFHAFFIKAAVIVFILIIGYLFPPDTWPLWALVVLLFFWFAQWSSLYVPKISRKKDK